MSEKNAIKALRDLGLTEYEAKVYTALTRIKAGIASEIHQISGIPRSAVYGALKKLVMRGIVEVQPSKPMRYKVADPSAALERLKSGFMHDAEAALHALEEVYSAEEIRREEEPGLWMQEGIGRVYDKSVEAISSSQTNILIINPSLLEHLMDSYNILVNVIKELDRAADRGVSIRVVCPEEAPATMLAMAKKRYYPWRDCGTCLIVPDFGDVLIIISHEHEPLAITAKDALATMYRDLGEALWLASSEKDNHEHSSRK